MRTPVVGEYVVPYGQNTVWRVFNVIEQFGLTFAHVERHIKQQGISTRVTRSWASGYLRLATDEEVKTGKVKMKNVVPTKPKQKTTRRKNGTK